jgi:hypothetical protein
VPVGNDFDGVAGTKTFVVTAMPAGALPIEMLVRIGAQRWTGADYRTNGPLSTGRAAIFDNGWGS